MYVGRGFPLRDTLIHPSRDTAAHLCFGNFIGQRVQQGDYGHLVEFFNRLNCSHLVLETMRRPLEEIELLREVKPEITFGLGVIDVKDLQIEQPQTVAQVSPQPNSHGSGAWSKVPVWLFSTTVPFTKLVQSGMVD